MEGYVTLKQELADVKTDSKVQIVHLNHVPMIVQVMGCVTLNWEFALVKICGLKNQIAPFKAV